jgi:hypothetical protein
VHKILSLAPQDRQDLFRAAALQLGLSPTVIEKDFWVCYVLQLLFRQSRFRENFVFKGGTSLSKAHGLIERFSEDVDLVLDARVLGLEAGLTSGKAPLSKTQQDKLNKDLNRRAGIFIAEQLIPELDALTKRDQSAIQVEVDAADPQVVALRYPAAFAETYIRPEVRLEIGPLASWVPSAIHAIQPYAAPLFPSLFDEPSCPVLTIAAERTFWEKATILHQEAHRTTILPKRYSRHYYDLFKLAVSPVKAKAFAEIGLLRDVVEFKTRFYPVQWARYDTAAPGTFKLLHADADRVRQLEQDYREMQIMLFGEPPAFTSILSTLQALEQEINALVP